MKFLELFVDGSKKSKEVFPVFLECIQLRSKGDQRDVNVAHVPFLVLTHLVQSAGYLLAGAEYFIALPLQIGV